MHPTVLLTIGLLLFAAAFAYGPATSVERGRARVAALVASLVPAALASLVVSRHANPMQLSMTQWLALVLAGWVAHCWTLTKRPPEAKAASADSG